MEQIRIGVIGAGRIGRLHAENLTYGVPGAELVAVADMIPEAARSCADELHIANAFADPEPILEDKSIAAVLICSSTDTHAELIEQAARAGKHIFCEKPIALDLETIDCALNVVEREDVILQVGFNRRFDPSFQRVQRLIADGEIGSPWMLKVTSRDPAPPPMDYIKVSGGIFLDMTIHDFDMARFMMMDEVEEVFAAGNVLVDPHIGEVGDVDTTVITLKFHSGAIGVIVNSRQAKYGYDQRVEVFGEKGDVRVDNPKPDTVISTNTAGEQGAPLHHFFVERYSEAYIAEMNAFITSIREDTPPLVTGLDGKLPVVIGYAAKLSQQENRPVRVDEIDPR